MSKTQKAIQAKVAKLLKHSASLVNGSLGENEFDGILDLCSIEMDAIQVLLQPAPGQFTSVQFQGTGYLVEATFDVVRAAAVYIGRGEYFKPEAEEDDSVLAHVIEQDGHRRFPTMLAAKAWIEAETTNEEDEEPSPEWAEYDDETWGFGAESELLGLAWPANKPNAPYEQLGIEVENLGELKE